MRNFSKAHHIMVMSQGRLLCSNMLFQLPSMHQALSTGCYLIISSTISWLFSQILIVSHSSVLMLSFGRYTLMVQSNRPCCLTVWENYWLYYVCWQKGSCICLVSLLVLADKAHRALLEMTFTSRHPFFSVLLFSTHILPSDTTIFSVQSQIE